MDLNAAEFKQIVESLRRRSPRCAKPTSGTA
jgi:hypothetical protein